MGFRWEWAIAAGFVAVVSAGTLVGLPPFSSLLTFNEAIKASWEKPADRAPIPHAELLTLGELAEKAKVDLPTALARLRTAGITDFTDSPIMAKLAEQHRTSGQQLFQIIVGMGTSTVTEDRPAGGSGAGGGPGRKTLAEYCTEPRMAVADALARLKAKGRQAGEQLTLREIAVNNGYEKPAELLDVIHGR